MSVKIWCAATVITLAGGAVFALVGIGHLAAVIAAFLSGAIVSGVGVAISAVWRLSRMPADVELLSWLFAAIAGSVIGFVLFITLWGAVSRSGVLLDDTWGAILLVGGGFCSAVAAIVFSAATRRLR